MGLLGSIGNIAGDAARSVGGAIVGGPVGAVAGGMGGLIFGQQPPNPNSMTNSVDPRLQQMKDQQIKAAQDYQTNLPAYEKQQQNAATDQSRQALAQELAGTTRNSNARGMLYGSYNQGQQARMTAANAGNLAATKANINTGAQSTLSQLQDQALGTSVNINQTQQAENNAAYQMALQEQLSNNQAFGSLMNGFGGIGGLLAGRG